MKGIHIFKSLCRVGWIGHPQTLINTYKAHLEYNMHLKNSWEKIDIVQALGVKVIIDLMKSSSSKVAETVAATPY